MPRDAGRALRDALQSLGLTALEADVYAGLLRLGRATGYRVGREIGRPTANVYKALDALTDKGAVLVQEGGDGLFAPVPPERFLGQLREAFARSEEAVLAGARDLKFAEEPAGIFALHTAAQLAERLQTMIESAQRVVLVDAAPAALDAWSSALAAAAARGVRVLVKAYAPAALRGAEVAVDPKGADIHRRWSLDWLHVVVDGCEVLLSAHKGGQLLRGLWTQEAFVAVCYHDALAAEIMLAGLHGQLQGGATPDQLKRTLDGRIERVRLDALGFERLRRQLQVDEESQQPHIPAEEERAHEKRRDQSIHRSPPPGRLRRSRADGGAASRRAGRSGRRGDPDRR
jgi:HTH-type transcriptional regulator, sugar sensing transcriptional regulator